MAKESSGERIPKDVIRRERRKFNGATRRFNTAVEKIKNLDKELEKSITSTRRKTLQSQKIVWSAKMVEAKCDIEVSQQRLNHGLDANKRIDRSHYKSTIREIRIDTKVKKLSFVLQNILKNARFPATQQGALLNALRKNDSIELRKVLMEVNSIEGELNGKITLPADDDDVTEPLLISMLRWFKSRIDVDPGESTEGSSELAPIKV